MQERKRSELRLYGALVLVWLALNLPLLAGLRVIPWDAIDEFYPTVWFNAHSLRHGLAPWWNPYIYSGFPQIADPQGMMFSPLMMGWMLLPSDPGAPWFVWGVLLHLLMGATGMLAFLRRKQATCFGALVGATVFMAGGVAASRLEHVPITLAYAYVPVVLLLLARFFERPGWKRALAVGLAAGALTTHLVQASYLFALMLMAYAAMETAQHWSAYDGATRRRWMLGMGLALLISAMICLPQLLFSWAFLQISNRALLPLSSAANASLSTKAFVTFLDPNAFHALRGSYDGPADRVEAFFYVGTLPILLLANGLPVAWRQPLQRRLVVSCGIVVFFSALYMLGTNTSFYGWLYSWLPGVRHFRRPSDAAYLLNLAASVVIGLCASHLRFDQGRRLVGLLIVAAAWLALISAHMRDERVHWQAASMLAGVCACLAAWRLARPGSTRRTTAWLLVVLVADYRCFNLNGAFNQAHDKARSFRSDAATLFLAHELGSSPSQRAVRVENLDAGVTWDNLVVLAAIPSTQGYNPLRYSLYDRWYGARENGNQPRPSTPYNSSPSGKLASLLGVGYLIRRHGDGELVLPGYKRVFADARTEVWRNQHAYPHLLTPVRAQRTAPGKPPSPSRFEATDFRDTVWLTPRDARDAATGSAAALRCTGRLKATTTSTVPTRLSVDTRGPAPGWLVLGDLDFPGWTADIDGKDVPIHRANGLFRAVCVPAGSHTVRFTFHPVKMAAEAWRNDAIP